MKTKKLDSDSEKSFREPIIRTLAAYYFYLVLGFCVSAYFVLFISELTRKFPDQFGWLNAPKYCDPEHPIKYLASIAPDILFATSIFIAGTLASGYLTTVFFSRKSINWKQITLRAYSHGTLCAVLFISIFSLMPSLQEPPILVTFGILCYAAFACASPFLLLLLAKKQINNQQVEPKRTNKVISYTLTVLSALLLMLTYKLLIEINYIKYLYPSYDFAHENEQKMKEMIRYFDLVLSPLLIFLFVKTATLITFRLQSVCNYLNKRNVALIYFAAMILPAVIIGLTVIINVAFSSEKLEVIVMTIIPVLVFPLLLHFLAQRNHFPKLPRVFRLY